MAESLIQYPLSFLESELGRRGERLLPFPRNRLLETRKQNELPVDVFRYFEGI
jgi:hypothetical protein